MTVRRLGRRAALPALLSLAWGCSDATTPEPSPSDGLDLETLFRPATAAEIASVRAEWDIRELGVSDLETVHQEPLQLATTPATVRVLAHRVDGALHYGAVVTPDEAAPASLPVLIYAHGGDDGVAVEDVQLIAAGLEDLAASFAVVIPSFRSEELRLGTSSWRSEGAPSPWDRDVDDALSLLDAAIGVTPQIDTSRVAVVGFSRGGGVALLMGARDPRIDGIIEFFGPTDFFDTYVQEIVAEAIDGSVRDLPGLDVLVERHLEPLLAGLSTEAEFRVELVRRSPVLYADQLPALQAHHGTEDQVVAASQAQSLERALEGRGPGAPPFEVFLYPGGIHNPLSLTGSFGRARNFLEEFLHAAASESGGFHSAPGAR